MELWCYSQYRRPTSFHSRAVRPIFCGLMQFRDTGGKPVSIGTKAAILIRHQERHRTTSNRRTNKANKSEQRERTNPTKRATKAFGTPSRTKQASKQANKQTNKFKSSATNKQQTTNDDDKRRMTNDAQPRAILRTVFVSGEFVSASIKQSLDFQSRQIERGGGRRK